MSNDANRMLPTRPSGEHLRKEAKRWARDKLLGLAEAQRSARLRRALALAPGPP